MMMEGMIYNRVTPLLKCMVLFLFIFTAKVLTSRPHDSQDSRNSIQHQKPSHYVRTFTKYHHRRTIQWNNAEPSSDWSTTQDQPKVIGKRSIESSNEYSSLGSENIIQLETESIKSVIDTLDTLINKTGDEHESTGSKLKKMKVKAAIIVTDAPTTLGPTISCLYKLHSVSLSVTPSYRDKKDEFVVENEIFDGGVVTEETLPNGELAQVEKCTDPKAFCYTLWHQDTDGNTTVLGQGCWRSSQGDQDTCDKCITVTELLPGSKFCCCTDNYCNANFTSIREEVAIKAESTMESSIRPNYSSMVASGILAVVAFLLMIIVFNKLYCKRRELDKDDLSHGMDVEKGDVMGSGPDALATGLSCVDNLTLIEHIGQGKFGSVWRGSLGSTPVAVKLYSNPAAWHKEASVYAIPHLAHPNILRFYGSDVRAALGGGGRRLLVVELCAEPLRARLVRAPLSWPEFASLAHGLAAALAHLHAHTATKPCVVHRDVNSGNVLIGADGAARLADLGLAQPLYPKRERAAPDRITEAGTLRYLSPEALEGALDLSGARAALCAVDVFALALVLWEMLWRCEGAHPGPAPPYAPPYAHLGLPARPTLAQMQNLVSRNKARPPLPRGPGPDARALRLAADTCDECWDHDAEARLTAVCVEERMAELKTMLQAPAPLIHDNNLHPRKPAEPHPPSEVDKNSNCRAANGDITTALYFEPRRPPDDVAALYPDPHIGRNVCIQRNTNTPLPDHKEIKEPSAADCLSVARALSAEPDRLNEIRSYPRPLDYVPNDVSAPDDRTPKRTNQDRDKSRWGIKRFFERKLSKAPKDTEVKLIAESPGVVQAGRTRTALLDGPFQRPATLAPHDRYAFEPGTLSPPNRTLSPTMMELGADRRPPDERVFAVIVPRARPDGSSDSLKRSTASSIKANSESEDSTVKKRLSDTRLIGSGRSSRASVDLELRYIGDGAYDPSDCSSSEDEHLLLLSDGGSRITMQAVPRDRRYQNEILKEASLPKTTGFNRQNKYANFDNEFSDPNDKENVNGYSGDNPVYFAALNGEIDASELKMLPAGGEPPPPKPTLKSLSIKRQHSLEQVNGIFASSGDVSLQNPAGRVKTPGDLPVAVRRARRDRALQKGRASECNRLSLYDDRMMFGNSL